MRCSPAVLVLGLTLSPLSALSASPPEPATVEDTHFTSDQTLEAIHTMLPGAWRLWQADVPGAVRSTCVTGASHAVVMTEDSTSTYVTHLSPDGKTLWTVRRDHLPRGTSVRSSDNGNLVCLQYGSETGLVTEVLGDGGELLWTGSLDESGWATVYSPSPGGEYLIPNKGTAINLLDRTGRRAPVLGADLRSRRYRHPTFSSDDLFGIPGRGVPPTEEDTIDRTHYYPVFLSDVLLLLSTSARSESDRSGELILFDFREDRVLWRRWFARGYTSWLGSSWGSGDTMRVAFWGEGRLGSEASYACCFDAGGDVIWESRGPEVQWLGGLGFASRGRLLLFKVAERYPTGEWTQLLTVVDVDRGVVLGETYVLPPGGGGWESGLGHLHSLMARNGHEIWMSGLFDRTVKITVSEDWEHASAIRVDGGLLPVYLAEPSGAGERRIGLLQAVRGGSTVSLWQAGEER